MKIAVLCNYFQPMHYAENEIVRELSNQGHVISIFTGNRYFPFPSYKETVQKYLGSREVASGTTAKDGVTIIRNSVLFECAARAVFGGVKDFLQSFKPTIIIVFGISTPVAIQAALFKPQNARLIMVDSHLPSELSRGNPLFKTLFYGLFRFFFAPLISQRTDKIIAVQEATVDVITTTYGITKKPEVISHGTNEELFTYSSIGRNEVRKQLKVSDKDFLIVYTGKIIESKGIEILIKAVSRLLPQYPHIHLLLVGSGPKKYTQSCLELIPLAFKNNIHWIEFQPQEKLPAYYSASEVAVWPLQESLAMIDAASCALPFIVNSTCGAKERLSYNNALMYKQGNVEDLAKKIAYLYLHPKERKAMGERGRELVTQKMSWKTKAAEYLNVYD